MSVTNSTPRSKSILKEAWNIAKGHRFKLCLLTAVFFLFCHNLNLIIGHYFAELGGTSNLLLTFVAHYLIKVLAILIAFSFLARTLWLGVNRARNLRTDLTSLIKTFQDFTAADLNEQILT